MTDFMDPARRILRAFARAPDPAELTRSRTIRQIVAGADVYEVLGEPTDAVRRALRRRYGAEIVAQMAAIHSTWRVTREQAELYLEWLQGRSFSLVGNHALLVAQKRNTLLGRILESDHLLEQRIHRMMRDGPMGHSARTAHYAQATGDAQRALERDFGADHLAERVLMNEALAVLVPANEVVAYRLGHHLRTEAQFAPWYYHHQGLSSKTARMQTFIPWRLEGEFSYQELFDATRWVLFEEMKLPRGLEPLLRDDFAESIIHAIQHEPLAAEYVLPALPGRIRSPDSPRLDEAVRQYLRTERLDRATFFERWKKFSPITGPVEVQAELAEEARLMREAEEAAAAAAAAARR